MVGRWKDRSAGELVILLLAVAISVTIVINGLVIVLVFLLYPDRDVSAPAAGIADMINTTVGALIGFLAGSRMGGSGSSSDVVSPG